MRGTAGERREPGGCPLPTPWHEYALTRFRQRALGEDYDCYPLPLRIALSVATVAVLLGSVAVLALAG